MQCPVNSHNEWDTLEEVIVGDGLPTDLPALDFTFKVFFHDNVYNVIKTPGDIAVGRLTPQHYITKRHVEEHKEDIDSFADLLKSNGIKVRRPKVPKKVHKIKTPNWESTIYPALNVRDITMVVGNEIIETPPSLRFRYFENDYLKHIFIEYFKSGAKWTVSPRPLMLDESFDLSYFEKDNAIEYYNQMKEESYMECGHEIMFDAANCMRLGRHILFNSSSKNADMGAEWLQRHLGDDYKVWVVRLTDTHIDSIFLPLRPGVAFMLKPELTHLLPEPIQKWDLINVPMRFRTSDDMRKQQINLASPRIELNVLSIDQNTIICHEQYERELNSILKKYKITAIPCRMRHCEVFSGAHHCLTLDVRRKSRLEDYFV